MTLADWRGRNRRLGRGRNARDEGIVEERRVPLVIERLLVPLFPSLDLRLIEMVEPDRFLCWTKRTKFEEVIFVGESDALRE